MINGENTLGQYAHIISGTKSVKLDLTPEQQAVIFAAFDNGIDYLDEDRRLVLDGVIQDLKNGLWR